MVRLQTYARTKNTSDTHIRLTAICLSIRWAICKSAPRSRQVTMPVPHHSVFYRPDALPATQPTASKHWRHVRNKFLILAVANSGSGMWGIVSNGLCIKWKMDTGQCRSHHLISSIRTIKNIQSTDPHKKNQWMASLSRKINFSYCMHFWSTCWGDPIGVQQRPLVWENESPMVACNTACLMISSAI